MTVQTKSNKPKASTATNNESIYKILDLETSEIRVLKLLPSRHFESLVEGYLVQRPLLSDEHEYEAVSYVWGSQEFSQKMRLNGKLFSVTRNLEMILRHLRSEDAERTLWIDALCIYQNDIDERSRQVSLMKQIYAGCKVDLAWMLSYQDAEQRVGNSLNETHLSSFKRSLRSSRKQQDQAFDQHLRAIGHAMAFTKKRAASMVEGARAQSGDELSVEDCANLSPFFNFSSLWHRVWTMQELTVAPRLVMVAGPHQLDWNTISDFLGDRPIADAYHALFQHFLRSMDWNRTLGGALKVNHQRKILREGQYSATLLDVLARFQSNEAADPRDCVYGLLGLVTEDHGLSVDYTRSTAQVFTDTTMSIIQSSHNLDVICQTAWMVDSPTDSRVPLSEASNLPSWVPDYSHVVEYHDHEKILFAQRQIYSMGWDTYEVQLTDTVENSQLLPVTAVVLDILVHEIANPGRRYAPIVEYVTAVEQWLQDFGIDLETFNDSTSYAPTKETKLRAYWRTLLMDCSCYPIQRLTEENIIDGDKAFRAIFGSSKSRNTSTNNKNNHRSRADGRSNSINRKSYAHKAKVLQKLWKDLPERLGSMSRRVYRTWSFSVTEAGLYIMVPHGRTGDIIASVEGAKVPLILREHGIRHNGRRTYKFVGTAYVHGYMDGEALRDVDQGRRSKEKILLL